MAIFGHQQCEVVDGCHHAILRFAAEKAFPDRAAGHCQASERSLSSTEPGDDAARLRMFLFERGEFHSIWRSRFQAALPPYEHACIFAQEESKYVLIIMSR